MTLGFLDDGRAEPDEHEYDSPYIKSPWWPWLTAGVVLGLLFILLVLVARACA